MDEPGADVDAVHGEPQGTSACALLAGVVLRLLLSALVSLVGDQVRADERAVLAAQ